MPFLLPNLDSIKALKANKTTSMNIPGRADTLGCSLGDSEVRKTPFPHIAENEISLTQMYESFLLNTPVVGAAVVRDHV